MSGAAQDFVLRRFLPGAELRVDLARARPPVVRVTPTVTEVAMGGNSRLTVLRILEPGVLDLPVERRTERRLPVHVVLAGKPASGWLVHGEPRADPPHVACAGAASRIADLDAIATLSARAKGDKARPAASKVKRTGTDSTRSVLQLKVTASDLPMCTVLPERRGASKPFARITRWTIPQPPVDGNILQ